MSSRKDPPASLICLARGIVFARLLFGALRTGSTKTRRRNAFHPCEVRMPTSVPGIPASRNFPARAGQLSIAEMSAPSRKGAGALGAGAVHPASANSATAADWRPNDKNRGEGLFMRGGTDPHDVSHGKQLRNSFNRLPP